MILCPASGAQQELGFSFSLVGWCIESIRNAVYHFGLGRLERNSPGNQTPSFFVWDKVRCGLVWVGLWLLLVPSSLLCCSNSSSRSCNPSGGCCAAEELQAADEECS